MCIHIKLSKEKGLNVEKNNTQKNVLNTLTEIAFLYTYTSKEASFTLPQNTSPKVKRMILWEKVKEK